MRIRELGAAVLAAVGVTVGITAGLTACTGGSSDPATNNPTQPSSSAYCTRLTQAKAQLSQLVTADTPSARKSAIDAVVATLTSLKSGAPAQVAGPLDQLITVFQTNEDVLVNSPTSAPKSVQVKSQLAALAQPITSYAATVCGVKLS